MEKSKLQRADFHYNFLKNIIVRLDFQGVLEAELEQVLPEVKRYLKSKEFDRYAEKNNNQINIELTNIDGIQECTPFKGVRNQRIYSFTNDDKGYTLDVSTDFICLNINSTTYIPFEEYQMLVPDIASILREKIDFFTVKRYGIRKINVCLVNKKENIRTLFSNERFGYFNGLPEIATLASGHRDTFSTENFRINLTCDINQGKANNAEVYRVSLDIDVYLDDKEKIEMVLSANDEALKMNDLIFAIYLDALTNEFKGALTSEGDFSIEGVLGVEPNE